MDRSKIIKYALIAAAGIGAGVGIYFIVKSLRRKNTQDAVDALIELFQKESELTPAQIERLRFIFGIENYKLPERLQKPFDNNLKEIEKAGRFLRDKNSAAYFATINAINNKLPADAKSDFAASLDILYFVIGKTKTLETDSNKLAARVGRLVKPSVDMVNSLGNYAYLIAFLPALFSSSLTEFTQDSAAVKNNPDYIVLKDLYSSKAYTPDRLKLFDKFWKAYSGKPFFVSEIKNVKL
jgi:hypothetical protein